MRRRPRGTRSRHFRVLDVCCCAGGATRGYQLAGAQVTGVDIEPQPNYIGEAFVQADGLDYIARHGRSFDFIHASWPCQSYSPLNAYNRLEYPDLINEGRKVLRATGIPYVMENVVQAPLRDTTVLCGAMFGVRVYRHRAFETGNGFTLPAAPEHPRHVWTCARNGYLPTPDRPFMTVTGGRHSEAWRVAAAEVMGVPWTKTIREVCESIPPVYTYWIGERFLAHASAEEAHSA